MTEEEMNEEFKTLAERYEMKEEQVRKIVPVDELTMDLCVEKAIKLVRDAAKVTEVTAEEAAAIAAAEAEAAQNAAKKATAKKSNAPATGTIEAVEKATTAADRRAALRAGKQVD